MYIGVFMPLFLSGCLSVVVACSCLRVPLFTLDVYFIKIVFAFGLSLHFVLASTLQSACVSDWKCIVAA